jgi:menaquinone-specific isochorismate synthase
MQKKLDSFAIIDGRSYQFTLTKTLAIGLDLESFFDHYPHIYLSPKDQTYEYYTSGAIYSSEEFIKIKSRLNIPCFFVGDENSYPYWGDLNRAMHIVPKKWAIKKRNRIVVYELSLNAILLNSPKINSIGEETSHKKALESIENIQSKIKQETFSKYVFAIMTKMKRPENLDLKAFLRYPKSGTKFFFKFSSDTVFMGMSPEWLYKRVKHKIMVDAVAGTALNTNISELYKPKIIEEFNFVKKDIIESLTPFISSGSFLKDDDIINTAHLCHRYNRFAGILNDQACDKKLIKALHPTAAISGYPKKVALSYFSTFETFERGYFAAPVGLYDSSKAYVAVAIRSMLVHDRNIHLFAGAGITNESCPYQEWEELNQKLQVMKHFLEKLNI